MHDWHVFPPGIIDTREGGMTCHDMGNVTEYQGAYNAHITKVNLAPGRRGRR